MRKLSYHQSKAWMSLIAKKRKYKNAAKGEAHPKSRLKNKDVKVIKKASASYREVMCEIFNICERHWYHIRQGKRWKHI